MYQKIQRIRLRKISRGPDSTKKSQKFNGAKIPTRKSNRPTMSRITATDRKKVLKLLFSMAHGSDDRRVDSYLKLGSENFSCCLDLSFLSLHT